MKAYKLFSIAAAALLFLSPATAMAKTNFSFSLNLFDSLVPLLAPQPVFVAPQPVVVAPPAPPVYYYVPPRHPPRTIVKEYHYYHQAKPPVEESTPHYYYHLPRNID
jgi:hypothetical protein